MAGTAGFILTGFLSRVELQMLRRGGPTSLWTQEKSDFYFPVQKNSLLFLKQPGDSHGQVAGI